MSFSRGSEWRKWDLHVHTPASFYWNDGKKLLEMSQDEKEEAIKYFIQVVNKSDIAVFCIMDYWTFDWYFELQQYIKLHPNELQKTVLPGMELRIESPTDYRLNIHVILSNNLSEQELNDFKSELLIRAIDKKLSNDALKKFAKTMDTSKAQKHGYTNPTELTDEKLLELGSKTAEITKESLAKAFTTIPDKSGFIIMPYDTSDGLLKLNWEEHPHDDNYFMQSSHIFETRDQKNIDLINGIKTPENAKFFDNFQKTMGNVSKPCVSGSDAHKYSDYGKFPSNKITWIKADPTFEGLKQIVYEPSRVHIGENRPQSALHKLEEVQLSFDENTKWDDDTFCFTNFIEPIKFSPYLSCIIGGRGSGKSTLLNLIAEKIGKGNKYFFSKLNEKSVASKVVFVPDVIENIEYLAQNEIEDFAKDSTKFTQAIFERLDKLNNMLSFTQNEITLKLKMYENQIDRLLLHSEKTKVLESKKNELNKTEYLLKTFMDDDFNTNYTTMNIFLQEKNTRLKWKTNYQNSLQELSEVIRKIESKFIEKDESPESWTNDNGYKDAQKDLNDELIVIFKKYQEMDFQLDTDILVSVEEEINNYKNKIDVYLQERGYSIENLNDLKNALSKKTIVQNEIKELEDKIEQINHDITSFSSVDLDESIYRFGCDINNEIARINQLFFEISNEYSQNVKEIKVEFTTNRNIFDSVFEQFITRLSLQQKNTSTLKDYLFQIALHDVLACDSVELFKEKITYRRTQAYDTLIEIFSSELNFNIYKLLIEKHLRNIEKYKILKVLYDNRELENSSFGQRCTAAIVILLSLGNNPIIIDEPEAHLDSSLIANYLVELIKQQKQQRQIIFATHNANFVLNADAELIIKLENTDGLSNSVSFAIEDLNHREDLLKLEGGKEAFKKREQKYNI